MNTTFLLRQGYLFVVALLFFFIPFHIKSQVIFDNTFGVGSGIAVKALNDGGYLLLAEGDTQLEAIRLNASGQFAFRQGVDQVLDRTIPVEGAILTAGGWGDSIRIRKTNLNNAVLFDKIIPTGIPDLQVNDICELSDEGYVLTGHFLFVKKMEYQGDTFDIEVRRHFLCRIDKEGNQVFFTTHNQSPEVNDNASSTRIIQRSNGTFLVAATRVLRDQNPSANAVSGIIMHLSSDGQLLEEIATPFISNYFNFVSLPGLINTADGGFALGGIQGYIAHRCTPYIANLVKYDADNQVQWDIRTVTAPGSLQLPRNFLFDIVETPRQNIIVLGMSPPDFCNPLGYPARMHLYDTSGINIANLNEPPLVSLNSSGNPASGGPDIIPTLDGNLILTGSKNGEIHAYKFGESIFEDIRPDLELEGIAVNPNPDIYSSFEVEFIIENKGAAEATNLAIQIPLPSGLVYVGGNEATASAGTFIPYGIDEWRLATLRSGERQILRVRYFNLSTLAKNIFAQVTRQDQADTDSQPNNGLCCTPAEDDEAVVIINAGSQTLPDLVWTSIDFLPTELAPGAAFNTAVNFENIGNLAAGSFDLRIYLSEDSSLDPGSDILLDNYRIFGLQAGSSGITSFRRQEIPDNLSPGNYYLLFEIDAAEEVAEIEETNNELAASITIVPTGQPDLIHQNLVNVPLDLTAGESFAPEMDFSVEGSTHIDAPFFFGLYLSEDPIWDTSDELLGEEISLQEYIIHFGYSQSLQPVQIPTNTPSGDYYIISKLDNQDAFIELEEDNNFGYQSIRIEGVPQPGVDLELSLSGPANSPANFSFFTTVAKLENKGTATAYNIRVAISPVVGAVFEGGNEYYATRGRYEPYGSREWSLDQLSPGESVFLTMQFFRLSPQLLYQFGYVAAADGQDIDSSPGYVPCCTPIEDDEAYLELGPNFNTQLGNRNFAFESSPAEITLLEKVYPNPAAGETTIVFLSKENASSLLDVYDALGQLQYREQILLKKGINQYQLDISGWAPGTYQVMLHPYHPYLRKAPLIVITE